MIDIVASSDFHGCLPEITKPFDLMLLAGDLEPVIDHSYKRQFIWYQEEFVPWINSLPFKDEQSKVVFIAGNHSCFLAQEGSNSPSVYHNIIKPCEGRLIYLCNQEYTFEYLDDDESVKEIKIFGTPYCKIFGTWWNMLNDDTLKVKYSEIPENLDILLSHDVPYGVCDKCFGLLDYGRIPKHIGNEVLRDAVLEKKVKYCISGHLHTGNHNWEQLGDTQVRQVSYLNESYQPTFEPYYFKWNDQVVQDEDLQ